MDAPRSRRRHAVICSPEAIPRGREDRNEIDREPETAALNVIGNMARPEGLYPRPTDS